MNVYSRNDPFWPNKLDKSLQFPETAVFTVWYTCGVRYNDQLYQQMTITLGSISAALSCRSSPKRDGWTREPQIMSVTHNLIRAALLVAGNVI